MPSPDDTTIDQDKPPRASVTSTPCTCKYLEHSADDPLVPISYDEEMGEYNMMGPEGVASIIYYCPFCGGAAPKSKRETMFLPVTVAEHARVQKLVAGVKTVEQAIAKFGLPDHDWEAGSGVYTPEKDGCPPMAMSYRTLVYNNLSFNALVYLSDYGPERGLQMTLVGKYRGDQTQNK